MNGRLPWDVPATDADDGKGRAAGVRRVGHLIAVTLLTAAALDLARCGLVLVTARHPGPATGLVAGGLAAAALSTWAAREYQGGRRWSSWAALLIGAASGPQAAASGFHAPYTIPDTATAVLGVLLTVAVLATAGQDSQTGNHPQAHCATDRRATRRSQAEAAQAGALPKCCTPADGAGNPARSGISSAEPSHLHQPHREVPCCSSTPPRPAPRAWGYPE